MRKVSRKDVPALRKEKIWTAIGLNGKKKNHNEKALGYIRLFGVKKARQDEIAGLAQGKTIFAIEHLFAELKKHPTEGEKRLVEILDLIVTKTIVPDVPHNDE